MDNIDIINSVVSMLVTDGMLPPQESEFLERLCQRLGVPNDELEMAFENFVSGKAYIYLPKDDDEKKHLFNYLLEAAVVDGNIAPQERQLLEAVATGLNIPHEHIEGTLNILLRRTDSETA